MSICKGRFNLSDCILSFILLASRFFEAAAIGELKRFVKTRPSKKKSIINILRFKEEMLFLFSYEGFKNHYVLTYKLINLIINGIRCIIW